MLTVGDFEIRIFAVVRPEHFFKNFRVQNKFGIEVFKRKKFSLRIVAK